MSVGPSRIRSSSSVTSRLRRCATPCHAAISSVAARLQSYTGNRMNSRNSMEAPDLSGPWSGTPRTRRAWRAGGTPRTSGRARTAGRIYWQGSHFDRLAHLVEDIRHAGSPPHRNRARLL